MGGEALSQRGDSVDAAGRMFAQGGDRARETIKDLQQIGPLAIQRLALPLIGGQLVGQGAMTAPQLATRLIHHRLLAGRRRARRADQLVGDAAECGAHDH